MKIISISSVLLPVTLLLLIGLTGCTENSPGLEYMPDMYRSPALEPNQTYDFYENGMAARVPAPNTIPRGYEPFPYPNNMDGYEAAGANLKNPLPYSDEHMKEGKVLYGKFCIHCHGKNGEGNGSVPEYSDYPNPPSYKGYIKDLPAGKIFFSIHYGKNLMGSHASQISKEDRWKLVFYVQKLQGHDVAEMYAEPVEEETNPETSI
ncbi:MAG TPA: cytochrome C [Flavobacteriales bacterium]|jgi:mono/diheme cytochrome c family protein|nr:cytochrome C [Flavobacteriales bacterium]